MSFRLAGGCSGAAVGVIGNRVGYLLPDGIKGHIPAGSVACLGVISSSGAVGFGVPVPEGPAGAGRGGQRYGSGGCAAVPLSIEGHGGIRGVAGAGGVAGSAAVCSGVPVLEGVAGRPCGGQGARGYGSAVPVQSHRIASGGGACPGGLRGRKRQRRTVSFRLAGRCPGAAVGVIGNRVGYLLPDGIQSSVRAGRKQLARLVCRSRGGCGDSPSQEGVSAANGHGIRNLHTGSIPVHGSGLHLHGIACGHRGIGVLRPVRPLVIPVYMVDRAAGVGGVGSLIDHGFRFFIPPVVDKRSAVRTVVSVPVDGSLGGQLVIQCDVLRISVIADGVG